MPTSNDRRPPSRRDLLQFGGAAATTTLIGCTPRQNTATANATPVATTSAAATATAGTAAVTGATPSNACVLTPEQVEGPYYLDTDLIRSDITEGKEGTPLTLNLTVQNAACRPLEGATVEIWHCDALGEYSGYNANTMQQLPNSGYGTPIPGGTPRPPGGPPPTSRTPGPGGPAGAGGGRQEPVNTLRFLRGGQVSDASGKVTFQTIFPGWYQGRTVHIHVKAFTNDREVHTGQLYIDDAISNAIYTQGPYASHPNRDTTNITDSIYGNGGAESMLALTRNGPGYSGTMTLVLQV